jgi:hypothetical protein
VGSTQQQHLPAQLEALLRALVLLHTLLLLLVVASAAGSHKPLLL